tara:strand:- start:1101 stop:1382 length:282 start_codon:yes stop_codon:yes gene_type:complete
MPSWDYYTKRRNIDLVKFILANNIENYEQLTSACAEREIDPAPEKGAFQAAYALAFPPIPKKQPTPKKAAPKTTKPKTTRKTTARKTSTRKSK